MRYVKYVILAQLTVFCTPVVYSFQVGSLRLTPTAAVHEGYDDNITSAGTNIKHDVSTTLSIGVDGLYEGKTEALILKGALEQELFAKEHDFNNTSEDFGVKYKKEFSEYERVTVDNSFTHADKPRTLVDEFGGLTAGRYQYYKNTFNLGMEHDFTEQFTMKAKYGAEYYDPSLSTLKSSMLNKPGLEADYAFSSKIIESLYYDYFNYVFEPGGTATKHETAAGVKRYVTPQVYVDGKIGSDFIHTIADTDTIKPLYYIGLIDEVDEITQAGISFTKSTDFNYHSSDLFDNWRIALNWGRQFTQRLSFHCAAFTGSGKFKKSGIKEDFKGAVLGFGYDISRYMKFDISYSFRQRNSSAGGNDYDKNTVSGGITVKF